MIWPFVSQEKKMRENAGNWLELADKVWHFRRDVLAPKEAGELQGRTAELRAALKGRADAAKLKLGIEALEGVLQRTGGAIYPKGALVENVEFFLVAAIVILGIRTFFVQPFKIPTNSMWPTYNGMTPEVFPTKADEPGFAAQLARFACFGATTVRIDAPADGEILIPLAGDATRVWVPHREVPGRTWLVIPTTVKEYTLVVGETPVTVQVPADFDFEWAVRDAFFPQARGAKSPGGVDLAHALARQRESVVISGTTIRLLRTGRTVRRGERALAFDIRTGDQLFVDRISYHFVRPAVGSGFVFRTGNIPGIAATYGDQYYIKRLVGTPGDTIEIAGGSTTADGATKIAAGGRGILMRNGALIAGAGAFADNNAKSGNYSGYIALGGLSPGNQMHVPPNSFLALGDNSGNSQDGRYWGYVPSKDVVGRPLFVYFPFTKHWGPAR